LHILPALAEYIVVPPAVVEELSVGEAAGVNLPDITEFEWAIVRSPVSEPALPLIADLGTGETEVLMLGWESRDAVVILDDALARRAAVLKLAGEGM